MIGHTYIHPNIDYFFLYIEIKTQISQFINTTLPCKILFVEILKEDQSEVQRDPLAPGEPVQLVDGLRRISLFYDVVVSEHSRGFAVEPDCAVVNPGCCAEKGL